LDACAVVFAGAATEPDRVLEGATMVAVVVVVAAAVVVVVVVDMAGTWLILRGLGGSVCVVVPSIPFPALSIEKSIIVSKSHQWGK